MSGEDEVIGILMAYLLLLGFTLLFLLVLGINLAIWIVLKAVGPNRRLRSLWEAVGVAISGLVAAGLLFLATLAVPPCLSWYHYGAFQEFLERLWRS